MNHSNFDFLQEHDPVFFQLASSAEQAFFSDPNTTLIKLRQLGEAMAQNLAARSEIRFDATTSQADLLGRISREIRLDATVRDLFHTLRIEGNRATHQFTTQHKEAMLGLKLARKLAIWFHQSFGQQGKAFKPGPFVPLEDPSRQLKTLQTEIDQLKATLGDANQQIDSSQELAALVAREKQEYEALAEQMDAEARTYELLAMEAEAALQTQKQAFEERLRTMQAQPQPTPDLVKRTQRASASLTLSEEETRALIDRQLMDAGWEADTQQLTHAKGARPERGRNRAIAEWPTGGKQSADYILFAGLVPVGVVEAKRENVDVAGKLPQAMRYAAGYKPAPGIQPAWTLAGRTIAWPDHHDGHYQIPFVYSCNGRPFKKQLAEKSGTWFRDLRDASNLAEPLQGFHSPQGLLDRLTRSKAEAEQRLRKEGFAYLNLRDYQIKAVQSVEAALEQGRTNCLLAMATGTGKTRTIIGLMYRFLKTERFKRILFLVDRTALGEQAIDMFNDASLEQNQTLSTIYNLAELGDMAAQAETRIQVATVQAIVRRIFQSDTPPAIDEYDCILVDEAHRGYTLDQQMTDGELEIRDQAQYLSSYRRVLEYFDAARIGLTATPAIHTTEIFGKPVYTYSYREAVADDWLIDHEPPIRYETLLSQNGIRFEKGQQVSVIDTRTGELDSAELPDEMNFEVEAFNKRVITEGFNQVISEQLVQEFDPAGDEKVMIFCATDLHADMVKRLLDDAFKELYGDEYNEAAVRKITGASDKVSQLIQLYKNERYPTIAITVDLLTTGIDVPKICHLVFLRRVRSRILYEQMIGRATRRCDEIGKTVFKIHDPVDIYAALQEVSTMKPLVKDPGVTLQQLVQELRDPASHNAPGEQQNTSHADDVLDDLGQRIMRVMRKANHRADSNPPLKQKLDELEQLWGLEPDKLHNHLHEIGPQQAAEFLSIHHNLIQQIDEVKRLIGSERNPIIYEGEDTFIQRSQTWGVNEKPQDYLDSFNAFIRERINQSAALSVVVNRPKDLTRQQLKEIRLLLDQNGYTEAKLASAWRNQTNQEIAASIIGHIRQAALGEALIPFEQRVQSAMARIYGLHDWSPVQRKWLQRLAKQLTHEVVIDQEFVNRAFSKDGGAKMLDKRLGSHLDEVLDELAKEIWKSA